MKTKICSKCKKIKYLNKFYKDKSREDTLQYQCKDCCKEYYNFHKEEVLNRVKKRYKENKDVKKEYDKKYRLTYKKLIKEYQKQYYESHKKNIKDYIQSHKKERNKRMKQRRNTDINYKIRCNLRNRTVQALKNKSKSLSTIFLIGCDIEYLMYYLQNQFKKRMNWDNYGKWHIDHIKPCVSFDLSKTSEQKKCFNYTNLQPLWAEDNYKKGRKFDEK